MTLHMPMQADYSWAPRNNDYAPVSAVSVSESCDRSRTTGDDVEFEAIFLYVEATFPKTIAYLAK